MKTFTSKGRKASPAKGGTSSASCGTSPEGSVSHTFVHSPGTNNSALERNNGPAWLSPLRSGVATGSSVGPLLIENGGAAIKAKPITEVEAIVGIAELDREFKAITE